MLKTCRENQGGISSRTRRYHQRQDVTHPTSPTGCMPPLPSAPTPAASERIHHHVPTPPPDDAGRDAPTPPSNRRHRQRRSRCLACGPPHHHAPPETLPPPPPTSEDSYGSREHPCDVCGWGPGVGSGPISRSWVAGCWRAFRHASSYFVSDLTGVYPIIVRKYRKLCVFHALKNNSAFFVAG